MKTVQFICVLIVLLLFSFFYYQEYAEVYRLSHNYPLTLMANAAVCAVYRIVSCVILDYFAGGCIGLITGLPFAIPEIDNGINTTIGCDALDTFAGVTLHTIHPIIFFKFCRSLRFE